MSTYRAGFLTSAEADDLMAWLQGSVAWQTESIVLFGKRRPVPRLVSWFGDSGLNYRYSGQPHCCSGWPSELAGLRAKVGAQLSVTPNFLLLNRYRNGADSMGWHRDDEAGLGAQIASVSLGAPRSFLLREANASRSQALKLEHGSLLLFDGRTSHALPKTRRPVGERINLTFRVLQ